MTQRRFGRLQAVVSLVFAMGRVPFWLAAEAGSTRGRAHERAFFARIAKGFGITIELCGKVDPAPGTLFVMNHISWADIPVILAAIDADFVAKGDIARWPFIGRLALRLDPVFVARDEQYQSHHQVDAIRARLRKGRSVILCPEGTTSDGTCILPFRTSLFAAADVVQSVQPICLTYLDRKGQALKPQRMREVAWINDDDLLAGAARLARETTLARVELLPPISVESHANRKQLAGAVRHCIAEAYAAAANLPR